MSGQDPGDVPAPGSQRGCASPQRPVLAAGGSPASRQLPLLSSERDLSQSHLGTGLSCAEGGKEAEGNQLWSCLEEGPQRGCDRWKQSLAFPGQDVKCCSTGWGCGERDRLSTPPAGIPAPAQSAGVP